MMSAPSASSSSSSSTSSSSSLGKTTQAEDTEVEVVRGDDKPRTLAAPSDEAGDGEVLLVSSTNGWAADLPHARQHCLTFPLTSCAAEQMCHACFCYVCDKRADECGSWAHHCQASDKDPHWKALRDAAKRASSAQAASDSRKRAASPVPAQGADAQRRRTASQLLQQQATQQPSVQQQQQPQQPHQQQPQAPEHEDMQHDEVWKERSHAFEEMHAAAQAYHQRRSRFREHRDMTESERRSLRKRSIKFIDKQGFAAQIRAASLEWQRRIEYFDKVLALEQRFGGALKALAEYYARDMRRYVKKRLQLTAAKAWELRSNMVALQDTQRLLAKPDKAEPDHDSFWRTLEARLQEFKQQNDAYNEKVMLEKELVVRKQLMRQRHEKELEQMRTQQNEQLEKLRERQRAQLLQLGRQSQR